MAQLQKGETFTDVSPGKTVTSTRLNNHVDGGILLKGAVTEQTEITSTALDDCAIVSDTSDGSTSTPKKVQLSNLLPEVVRQGVPSYAAGTLSGGVYSVTLDPAATAYTAGMVVRFKADSANSGAVDVNVNAVGAKNIYTRAGAELAANDILSGQIVELVYDGTNFLMTQALSAGEVTATHCVEANRQGVHQYAAGVYAAGVYAVTLAPAATAYTAGMVVRFKADTTNTGAVDIAVNGLAAKNLYKGSGGELSANDILSGQMVTAVYDGTNFQVVGRQRSWDYSGTGAVPASSGATTIAHGLGVVPTKLRAVLLQNTAAAQSGYAQNDEVSLSDTQNSNNGNIALTVSVDASNVTIARVNSGSVMVVPKTGGAVANITDANWLIKIYASV